MKTLNDLFLAQLQDMYDSERRLTHVLPKLAKAATDEELREAFNSHLQETEEHVRHLEAVFKTIDQKPKARKCKAIVGLIEEGDEIIAEHKGSPALNAALICAGQKAEHYEIATYGCLQEWAKNLGNPEAESLLGDILSQEKAANEKLSELAISHCNDAAKEEVSVGMRD